MGVGTGVGTIAVHPVTEPESRATIAKPVIPDSRERAIGLEIIRLSRRLADGPARQPMLDQRSIAFLSYCA
jgi:hypothetical protein